MDVIVKSKNCEPSSRIKEQARDRVHHALRIFDRVTAVELLFSEEQNPRIPEPARVEVTARTKGHHLRAEGAAADHRDAIEVAMARFERQLRRYKARLIDRSRRGGKAEVDGSRLQPSVGVGAPAPAEAESDRDAGGSTVSPIVRRKVFALKPMVPEDAAWQLELLGHEFYLFLNAGTGRCSVVYRRRDGTVGLIEAAEEGADTEDGVAAASVGVG